MSPQSRVLSPISRCYGWHLAASGHYCDALQSQKAVTAYFSSGQLLPYGSARQYGDVLSFTGVPWAPVTDNQHWMENAKQTLPEKHFVNIAFAVHSRKYPHTATTVYRLG